MEMIFVTRFGYMHSTILRRQTLREEAKFRDFLAHKYERKRWYLPASDDMHNEAQRQNELV
jgi:hypothetical protein